MFTVATFDVCDDQSLDVTKHSGKVACISSKVRFEARGEGTSKEESFLYFIG
jgi:hypothetical protein